MMNPVVHVNMLGRFAVSIDGKSIDNLANQSRKPWILLEYLIANRNHEISAGELIELIWSSDESSNPGGALKTLLFRSRKLLAPLGFPTHDLIIQQHGSYAWNPEIKTIVDADLFGEYCTKGSDPGISIQMQLGYYLRALDLYQGDFLPKSGWEPWVISISTYYHTLYQETVHKSLNLLSAEDNWAKVIEICQKAIAIEPYDEAFHYNLIYALFKNGDQQGALKHYAHTNSLFYDEFAITPSTRLKDLYKIIQDEKHKATTDLSIIQESLQEETQAHGAFYCEYTVFRDIYQLEKRAISRTGDSIYLCLLTISGSSDSIPKAAVIAKAMMALGESIMTSLRRGDTYTRYSVSQYMILLPSASYENGALVLGRICTNFHRHYSRKKLTVNYSLQAVLPSGIDKQGL